MQRFIYEKIIYLCFLYFLHERIFIIFKYCYHEIIIIFKDILYIFFVKFESKSNQYFL